MTRLAVRSFGYSFAVTLMGASLALAADPHHGEAKSGLPQLDPSSFSSQLFWLFLVFGILYFFFSKKSLPEITQVIENRNDRIQNDLDTAQRLKDEVSSVQKSYEGNISKSRNESFSMMKTMEEDMKKKTDSEMKRLQQLGVSKTLDLEKSIDKARHAAMDDMNRIASEIAIDAAEKIIGVRPDFEETSSIVRAIQSNKEVSKAKAA